MYQMMITIQSCVRQGQLWLLQLGKSPRVRALAETLGSALAGLLFSAASLSHHAMTLTVGLVCGSEGWQGSLMGLGGCIGYLLFWHGEGLQGVLWMCLGMAAMLMLGKSALVRNQKLMMPAVAGLIVSASGVIFQIWMEDTTSIPIYLLRVFLAAGSTWIVAQVRQRSGPGAIWVAGAMAVLALAQIAPVSWLGLGYLAAGFLCVYAPLPAGAMAGLALDLAGITPVPMTGVLCFGCLTRLLPRYDGWIQAGGLCVGYFLVMSLTGIWDWNPMPGLMIGSTVACLLPKPGPAGPRRGETGPAQVCLELAAGALTQTQQLLLEVPEPKLDAEALLTRGIQRACQGCPCRKSCRDRERIQSLSPDLLRHCLPRQEDFPVSCKKTGRILQELHRSQESYRTMRAEQDRIRECRNAVIQQYQFLSDYLREVSDRLAQGMDRCTPRFRPELSARSYGREKTDGDRCVWFPGVACRYFVLLCDGMGTGMGAAQESRNAIDLLQRMLRAGFPGEYALRSFNSLCALRGWAGAVCVDLVELQLDTGKTMVYKWGAVPSWLIRGGVAEKIGTAGPPPGLSVTDGRETVERLSLRRGETLILLSDGVDGEGIPHRAEEWERLPPGELVEAILEQGRGDGTDDATAAVVRLVPVSTSP